MATSQGACGRLMCRALTIIVALSLESDPGAPKGRVAGAVGTSCLPRHLLKLPSRLRTNSRLSRNLSIKPQEAIWAVRTTDSCFRDRRQHARNAAPMLEGEIMANICENTIAVVGLKEPAEEFVKKLSKAMFDIDLENLDLAKWDNYKCEGGRRGAPPTPPMTPPITPPIEPPATPPGTPPAMSCGTTLGAMSSPTCILAGRAICMLASCACGASIIDSGR